MFAWCDAYERSGDVRLAAAGCEGYGRRIKLGGKVSAGQFQERAMEELRGIAAYQLALTEN